MVANDSFTNFNSQWHSWHTKGQQAPKIEGSGVKLHWQTEWGRPSQAVCGLVCSVGQVTEWLESRQHSPGLGANCTFFWDAVRCLKWAWEMLVHCLPCLSPSTCQGTALFPTETESLEVYTVVHAVEYGLNSIVSWQHLWLNWVSALSAQALVPAWLWWLGHVCTAGFSSFSMALWWSVPGKY